jgi:hypothetical protein
MKSRILECAFNAMEQAVTCEEIDAANRPYGSLKKTMYVLPISYFLSWMVSHHFMHFAATLFHAHCSKTPFVPQVYTCPYQFKCGCYVAFSVKTYTDKVEVALARQHTATSHLVNSCILSGKQLSSVKSAIRFSPHAVGSQVHANLENFSPCKRVPFDRRNQNTVACLVEGLFRIS